MTLVERILLERHLIPVKNFHKEENDRKRGFLCSYLLLNFGVEIENPEMVNDDTLRLIDELLFLEVPKSFYDSPQDTKHFTSEELLLEQVVSYFVGYGTPIKRLELFKKVLPPKYKVEDRFILRTFRLIDEEETEKVLREVFDNLLAYKRPFSSEEEDRFLALALEEGFFKPSMKIACRDNIFPMLPSFPMLARDLDKKDLVKYSRDRIVLRKKKKGLRMATFICRKEVEILRAALPYVRDCPLSKSQAKYYNGIVKMALGKKGKEDNHASPYKTFIRLLDQGKIIDAAEYLKRNGSLLERNFRFLLSRCKEEKEIRAVIERVGEKNPTVLMQLYFALVSDEPGIQREFFFINQKKAKHHTESTYEAQHRKSVLEPKLAEKAKAIILEKIKNHYSKLPSLGKIYLSTEFRRIAAPINTSASGNGVDVLPSGSRIPVDGQFLRIYCHWDGIRDIDASLAVLKERHFHSKNPTQSFYILSWRNYYIGGLKGATLCSGDDTSENGTEYQDINIKRLKGLNYRYAIAGINGYWESLDKGEIYQGVQIKDEIDTRPWDPKNIAFQLNVKGSCRAFVGFALDLYTMEIVIVNLLGTSGRLFDKKQVDICKRYLHPNYLDINMYDILSLRGEIVDSAEEADVVFDRDYVNPEKKVIRPFDIDALVALVNE